MQRCWEKLHSHYWQHSHRRARAGQLRRHRVACMLGQRMQINEGLANGKEAFFFFNWNTWTGCHFLSPRCQLPLTMTCRLWHSDACHVITELHLSDIHCRENKTADRRCGCDIIIFWHHVKIKTPLPLCLTLGSSARSLSGWDEAVERGVKRRTHWEKRREDKASGSEEN